MLNACHTATCNKNESTQHFVVKEFVQTPDAEIKLDGRTTQVARWSDRWDRRCGNPAVSIIASK